jgi:hypothetical protein
MTINEIIKLPPTSLWLAEHLDTFKEELIGIVEGIDSAQSSREIASQLFQICKLCGSMLYMFKRNDVERGYEECISADCEDFNLASDSQDRMLLGMLEALYTYVDQYRVFIYQTDLTVYLNKLKRR